MGLLVYYGFSDDRDGHQRDHEILEEHLDQRKQKFGSDDGQIESVEPERHQDQVRLNEARYIAEILVGIDQPNSTN
jgi:hypothetical protein